MCLSGEMRYQERIKIIAVFVAKAFSIMSGGVWQVVRWWERTRLHCVLSGA